MIRLNDLTIGYGRRILLQHASATIPAGELVALVGRNGVGPNGVATMVGQRDGAQHADLRVRGLEGDIGVPGISPSTVLRVQLQKPGAIGCRHRRMRLNLTEQTAKVLVRAVGQMLLTTEEQHTVFQQRGLDLRKQRGGQIAPQLYALHRCTNTTSQRLNLQGGCGRIGGVGQMAGMGGCVHRYYSSGLFLRMRSSC